MSDEELNITVSTNLTEVLVGSKGEREEVVTFPLSCQEEVLHLIRAIVRQKTPASEVRAAWSSYLELVAEPAGWFAVLVPSQLTADIVGCPVGSKGAAVVEVTDILPDSLEAEVVIVNIPDTWPVSVHAISHFEVPVDELFPLKYQENSCLNLVPTAVALDLIRFFYKNVWMPWDNDSDCRDWPNVHLEARIQLHFDLVTGRGNRETANRLDELVYQAEINRTALEEMEDKVEMGNSEIDIETIGKLYKLHQEQEKIRGEAEMLENPVLRLAVRANQVAGRMENAQRKGESSRLLLVWSGGNLSDMGDIVTRVKEEVGDPNAHIQMFPDIQYAVDLANIGDTVVVLSSGEHKLSGVGRLSGGGKVLGMAKEGKVILVPTDTNGFFMEVERTGRLEIKNVDMSVAGQRVGIVVRGGELEMDNVILGGGDTAVRVEGRGRCKMVNCNTREAGVGLFVGEGSRVELVGCVMVSNMVGISVVEGAELKISSSYVGKNTEQGLLVRCNRAKGEILCQQDAKKEVQEMGIIIEESEINFNMLGDIILTEFGSPSRILDQTKQDLFKTNRRFSTPRFHTPTNSNVGHLSFLDTENGDLSAVN